MTNHQFEVELRIRAYIDQISGYILGWPQRETFTPIVPTINKADGSIDRQKTLDLPCYCSFTDDDKRLLLNTEQS